MIFKAICHKLVARDHDMTYDADAVMAAEHKLQGTNIQETSAKELPCI